MERFVLKVNEKEYVKWIQWTARVEPVFLLDQFEKAYIVSEEYLNYIIQPSNLTRKELLLKFHPALQLEKVKITLV